MVMMKMREMTLCSEEKLEKHPNRMSVKWREGRKEDKLFCLKRGKLAC